MPDFQRIRSQYYECGKKMVIALNRRDKETYFFERNWLKNALAGETTVDKILANASYLEGYNDARVLPKPVFHVPYKYV